MLPFTHAEKVRVRYCETDQMGVVWHGNYIAYFEAARTGLLHAMGHSYRAMEESGVMMPVVEVGVTYLQPAYYDDLLTVTVEIRTPPRARMRFDYTITGSNGEDIATGFTILAFMSRETRRPCKPPLLMRQLFGLEPQRSNNHN